MMNLTHRRAGARHGSTLLAIVAGASLLASLALSLRVTPILAVDDANCGLNPLDIELVIDRSGSMATEQSGGHSRMYWARVAATQLVNELDANGVVGNLHHVGLSTFGNGSSNVNVALGTSNAATVNAAIAALNGNGDTPLKSGLATGAADLTAHARGSVDGIPVIHVTVLLSDGRPNPESQRPNAGQISSYLASADVSYSIAVGNGGSGASQIDLPLMQALANPSANFRHVVEADDLPGLFSDIYGELACPQINVEKTPSVTDLPAGGGDVTYSYAVTNSVQEAPLSNVTVSDDTCAPVAFDGGDTSSDLLLQTGETWNFSCTMWVAQTTTNVVTASGEYNGQSFTDRDEATVTVADPTPEASESESPSPSPSESESPSPSPSESVSESPSPSPSESESQSPDPSPTGEVRGGGGLPNTAVSVESNLLSMLALALFLLSFATIVGRRAVETIRR